MESHAEHPHRIYFGDFASPFLLRWGKTCFLLTDSHRIGPSNLVTTFLAREWPVHQPLVTSASTQQIRARKQGVCLRLQAAGGGPGGVSASHRRTRIEGERNKLEWDGNLEVFLRFPEMGNARLNSSSSGAFEGIPCLLCPERSQDPGREGAKVSRL